MRIGIDLGGTKIAAIGIGDEGETLVSRRVATPRSYAETLSALVALCGELEAEAGKSAAAVGLGMPGSISPVTGLARNANSVWLNGQPFATDLAAALKRPVRVANDANCFALSEAVDGAGAGARCVFGVIIGTGCGGGLVVDGKIIEGASGVAGEWGHMPLPWPRAAEHPGPPCWCGRNGCMETWVSGAAFEAHYAAATGLKAKAADIAAQAAAGDAIAQAAVDDLADRLARGLAVIIGIVDPDVIVFGGGLSNVTAIYPAVSERLGRYVFSDFVAAKLVRNRHGDSSGVRGAAWLWRPEELA
jgi:fructokinase